MPAELSGVNLLRVCAVLSDCTDQLAVLGHIMPDGYRGRARADTIAPGYIGLVLEQQKATEFHLKAVCEGQVKGAVSEATQELLRSHLVLEHSLLEDPLSPDYLSKWQRDRQFAAHVINDLLAELKDKRTFTSLLQAVEEEKKRKADLQDAIIREEEGRLRIKVLKKQLTDCRKLMILELQKREELVAHLKDQLQDTKMKTSQETNYMKQSAELLVYQEQKLNHHQEMEMENKLQMLEKKLEEETRVQVEKESFLKKHHTRLQEKFEYWLKRYEKDIEDKQQELHSLKMNKTNNLAQLQDLARKYRESEQVIIDDRLEKENLRNQLEREQLERNAATKIQSWWRGTLVRKGLGAFKKNKKAKPKKESKKAKKK
ncbi:dynein regulatory complex protein 9 [Trichomycterus rosablanca]|uniref:dynein regulatory complex protein 9 n=1 Tax=Trichomycterus rosablanca TaxID=2290929 RepID=UPI002F35756F